MQMSHCFGTIEYFKKDTFLP